MDEIVVTAQKRSQSLQDVPVAVSALTPDALEQSGVRTLSDISQLVPGLNISDTQSEGISVSMRGINSNDFGFAVENSIPIYLDGTYLGLGTSLIGDLIDIAQVEVLKGPQGTLFGRNAAGGAVSITTSPISDEFEGNVRVQYGNYDLVTVSGLLNVPLVDDKLKMRLVGGIRKRDGWQTNLISGKQDGYEQDRWFGRAKLSWTPTENLELVLTSDYKKEDDNSGYYYLLDSDYPPSIFNPADFDTSGTDVSSANYTIGTEDPEGDPLSYRINRTIEGHSAHLTWDLNDSMTLTSTSSYRKLDYGAVEDNDGTEYLMLNVQSFGKSEEINQELRLSGQSGPLDWFVGSSYYSQDLDSYVEDIFGSFLVGAPITERNVGTSNVKSFGFFGDAIWSATDRLNFTVGARYSYDRKSQSIDTPNQNTLGLGYNLIFPSAEQLTDSEGNPDPSLAHLKGTWNDFSMRAVVDYKLTADSMVFFSASQGYKAGGFNSFPIVDLEDYYPYATPGQMTPYDEESVTSYELGIKSEWLDRRLRFNASLFYYNWDDLQVQVAVDKALFTLNAGKAVGKGADVDLTYQPVSNLTLVANLTYLDAKIDEGVPGTSIVAGDRLNYAPKISGYLGIDYEIGVVADWSLRANAGYSFNSSQYVSNGIKDKKYSLLNTRLTLQSPNGNWQMSLWARNLTNTSYLEQVSDFSSIGYVSARRNEPRTYGLEIGYKF